MRAKRALSGLASIIGLLSGCSGEAMTKDVTEFDWYGVATAPREYPMEVINGMFIYEGKNNIGVAIPSGGTLTQGWGVSTSVYVVGPKLKPLPDKVQVTFYSYAENQFYRGEFPLPHEKLLELFREKAPQGIDRGMYSSMLIGVAPGGAVSVWANGFQTTEVFFGQAEKVEMTPNAAFKLPFTSKEQSDNYVANALAESVTPEQLVYIKEHGAPLGTWSRFRNLYKWVPTYKDGNVSTDKTMPVTFLNGESYWLPTQFTDEFSNIPKPLPSHLQFGAGPKNLFYIIDFEPYELMNAFEKLGAQGEKVYIEFDPQVPRNHMKIRVYNDKESKEIIELKKFRVKP